jgi:hypothetical protein
MTRANVLTLALLPLCLAGCQQQGWPGKPTAPLYEAQVIGEPQSCIPLVQVRESRIRDDMTIDFMRGNKEGWRVSLETPCPGLKMANKFSYETSLNQLCNTDIIHVLHDYGGRIERGPGCGLSQFVPVKLLP